MGGGQATLQKIYHFKCRFLVLVGLACGIVMLTGYIIALVQGFIRGDLHNEITRFDKLNTKLEEENRRFEQNNVELESHVNDLSNLTDRLENQGTKFTKQNTRLEVSIDELNSTNTGLQQQVFILRDFAQNLMKKVEKLHKQTQQLNDTAETLEDVSIDLESELSQFESLRKGIESFANEKMMDFEKVVDTILGVFGNLTKLTEQNQKVDLFLRAENIEKIEDGRIGFTRTEYSRFLSQVASQVDDVTEDELIADYPYDAVAGPSGVVDIFGINKVIKSILGEETVDEERQREHGDFYQKDILDYSGQSYLTMES